MIAVLAGSLVLSSKLNDDSIDHTPSSQNSALLAPRFEIAWLRGQLRIAGHTLSRNHEQELLRIADAALPNRGVDSDFEPLGLVPAYWESVTLQVLSILPQSASARVTLTPGQLSIRAVTSDNDGWQERLRQLRSSLPKSVAISHDTIVVAADINSKTVCDKVFDRYEAGQINFEESTAVFRSSAYPHLSRILAIADACREAAVTITGHTDASGSTESNQRLSLLRARAVANYMMAGGIDPTRLRVTGKGSSAPLANNNTRYGRSLNRRIEIAFEND